MHKGIGLIVAAGIGLMTVTLANAQATFDPKLFFDDLQKQGAQLPPEFDGKKFFDDLQKQGASFDHEKPKNTG